jgi:hypothetical protein
VATFSFGREGTVLQPGETSRILRLIGQFLEGEDAREIGIEDHDEYLEVTWQNRRGEREERYHDASELAALRTSAELYRGSSSNGSHIGLSELLRTLGQELDELKLEGIAIAATPDGFYASGTVQGSAVSRTYTQRELIARTQSYRRARGTASSRH